MDLCEDRSQTQPSTMAPRGLVISAIVLAVALALLTTACGADDAPDGVVTIIDEDTTLVVANSAGTVTTNGPQRVLVALVGGGPNQYVGGEDQTARIVFTSIDGDSSGVAVGEWISNPGVALGLYVANFTFAEPGLWDVNLEGASASLSSALVEVSDASSVPEPGSPAPPSETPTGSSAEELALISTDPDPNPDFYALSIADAVANGRPSVIVFATPAFCRTAICGPTIEIVKGIAAGRDEVDFVHVEPFDIEAAKAGNLVPIEPMFEWGLATEPWVFVVDGTGTISASFEGIIGEGELERAIESQS